MQQDSARWIILPARSPDSPERLLSDVLGHARIAKNLERSAACGHGAHSVEFVGKAVAQRLQISFSIPDLTAPLPINKHDHEVYEYGKRFGFDFPPHCSDGAFQAQARVQ